jgi:hypothetical protein
MLLSIRKNERVESVGERVHWFKFRNADVTVVFWNWLPRVSISLHPPASLHPSPRFGADKYSFCPRCDSGRTIVPGQCGDLLHGIFLCLDCDLIFNLRHLIRVN